MKNLSKIINYLWEFPCPLCGCDSPQQHDYNSFCLECIKKLPLLHGKRCSGCGGELDGVLDLCSHCLKLPPRPWSNAMSVMKMEGSAEQVIYKLKFSKASVMARSIAEIAAPLLLQGDFLSADCLVPVPLHWTRYLKRTYNQSGLLAKMLARKLNKPCCNLLRRCRATTRQATLSREERLKNLKGAFVARNPSAIKGKTILLIDDVLTTGATLHACAEALQKAGAARILVFTAARRY